jgi:hypothetical protein
LRHYTVILHCNIFGRSVGASSSALLSPAQGPSLLGGAFLF